MIKRYAGKREDVVMVKKKTYVPFKEVRSTDLCRGVRRTAIQGSFAIRNEARFHGVRYEHRSVKISSLCRLLTHRELKRNNYQKVLLCKEQESTGNST